MKFMKLAWVKTNWLIVLDLVKTAMIGVLLFFAITLLGSLGNQAHQIKVLAQLNNNLSKQLNQSNKDIKTHIDCIITFFGLPNRASLSIANICHFAPSSATPLTPSPGPNTDTNTKTNSTQTTNTTTNNVTTQPHGAEQNQDQGQGITTVPKAPLPLPCIMVGNQPVCVGGV